MDSLIRFFFHNADYYTDVFTTTTSGTHVLVACIIIMMVIKLITIAICSDDYVIEGDLSNNKQLRIATIIACLYSMFEFLTVIYLLSFFTMGWFIALNIVYLLFWSCATGVKSLRSSVQSKLSYLTHAIFKYTYDKLCYSDFIKEETKLTKAQLTQ